MIILWFDAGVMTYTHWIIVKWQWIIKRGILNSHALNWCATPVMMIICYDHMRWWWFRLFRHFFTNIKKRRKKSGTRWNCKQRIKVPFLFILRFISPRPNKKNKMPSSENQVLLWTNKHTHRESALDRMLFWFQSKLLFSHFNGETVKNQNRSKKWPILSLCYMLTSSYTGALRWCRPLIDWCTHVEHAKLWNKY